MAGLNLYNRKESKAKKKIKMKHFLLFVISLTILGCDKEDITTQDPVKNLSTSVEYEQLTGVDPNLLSLDIYYNSLIALKKPVVIYVHGGGWIIGDKSNQVENKIDLFQSLDYIFVSINYRLSPFPYELNNPDRVMYPIHNVDVANAIKWVFDNISQYGGNSNKIALLGHSAGAHLVCLTGTNQTFLNNVGLNLTNIKGVAVIDTEVYDVLSKVQDNDTSRINAFGTDSSLNIQASPIFNIIDGVDYPKFFIAKRGNANRILAANNFISALEQNGVSVSQIDGSIYNHSGINSAIGEPGETLITNPLKQFFEECFE